MQQVRTGVAVFFFKAGKQFAASGVTGADQINTVITGLAQRAVDTATQADGRFCHADHQHGARQVRRNVCRKGVETVSHQRRTGRDVTTEHA